MQHSRTAAGRARFSLQLAPLPLQKATVHAAQRTPRSDGPPQLRARAADGCLKEGLRGRMSADVKTAETNVEAISSLQL